MAQVGFILKCRQLSDLLFVFQSPIGGDKKSLAKPHYKASVQYKLSRLGYKEP